MKNIKQLEQRIEDLERKTLSGGNNTFLTIKNFSKEFDYLSLEEENKLISFNLNPTFSSFALIIAKIVLESAEMDEVFATVCINKNGETVYSASKPVYKGENEITIVQSVKVNSSETNLCECVLSSLYNDKLLCKKISVDVIISGDNSVVDNNISGGKIVATENDTNIFIGTIYDGRFLYNEFSKNLFNEESVSNLGLYNDFGSAVNADVAYLMAESGEFKKYIFFAENDKNLYFYDLKEEKVCFVDSSVDSFSVSEIDEFNAILISYVKNNKVYYCTICDSDGLSKFNAIDFDYHRGVQEVSLSRGGEKSGLVYLCITDGMGVNYLLSLIFPIKVSDSASCLLRFGGTISVYEEV